MTPQKIEYRRPWLYPKQRAAIFHDQRFGVVEASTKSGKTVGCIAWLFEQAILDPRPHGNRWWVAPIYAQAKIAYRRLKRYLDPALYVSNDGEQTLRLFNSQVIWFKGADNADSLYGDDVRDVVVDEASRVKADAWPAIRSTLSATYTQDPMRYGKGRLIGNVKGRRNWAYQLARLAESGAPGWAYHRITAYDAADAGVLALEEIEAAQRELPAAVFRELYLAEPSDDQGNPFGFDAIAAIRQPLSTRPAVAYGIDLASKVDWTVVIGLDRDGVVCSIDRWQGPWGMTVPRILAIVRDVPTLADATGVGDAVVQQLQGAQRFTPYGGKEQVIFERANIEGLVFSAPAKQALIEGLAVAIQQAEVGIPDDPDPAGLGVLYAELEAFEYVYTRTGVRYAAPAGLHDDAVVAFALAVQHWRRQHLPALPPVSMAIRR